jgi:hypothetical protein
VLMRQRFEANVATGQNGILLRHGFSMHGEIVTTLLWKFAEAVFQSRSHKTNNF